MYRTETSPLPPFDLQGFLCILFEQHEPPSHWLARAHLIEPTEGRRWDVYLLPSPDFEVYPAGPMVSPARRLASLSSSSGALTCSPAASR